jgi:hypothetical protein
MNAAGGNRMGRWLALALVLAGGLDACKKSTLADLNPQLNVANDIIIGERPLLNAFTMLLRAATDTSLQLTHGAMIQNAWVTYNPGQMQYTFKYFGTVSPDGVLRSGRMDASLTGDFFTTGTTVKITFLGYAEDGMLVEGSDSIFCTGHVSGEILYLNRGVLTILKDTIGTIHSGLSLAYSIPWYAPMGYGQALVRMAGSDSGTSSKGFTYGSAVKDTLIFAMDCPWIISGTIGFTVKEAPQPAGLIQFVSGEGCSNRVNYIFGETVYQWRMQRSYLMD